MLYIFLIKESTVIISDPQKEDKKRHQSETFDTFQNMINVKNVDEDK